LRRRGIAAILAAILACHHGMPGPASAVEFFAAVPPPPLDRFVESIWAVRGTGSYERSAVLPNGALQLMLNFGEPHRVIAFGDRMTDRCYGNAWIAGLQDAPLAIASPRTTDLVSIRFRPGGAHAFLPLPPGALSHDVIDADRVLGRGAASLRDRVGEAAGRAAQVEAVVGWLGERLRPRERDFLVVERAVALLGARSPGESVARSCERLGVSIRHLFGLFRDLVGLPPKTFARVARFHRALARLPRSPNRAVLAHELGYADQAHFNHEFRRLAGVTPGRFVARRGEDDESIVLG
jgi:AraC-like DNA-binding protein